MGDNRTVSLTISLPKRFRALLKNVGRMDDSKSRSNNDGGTDSAIHNRGLFGQSLRRRNQARQFWW